MSPHGRLFCCHLSPVSFCPSIDSLAIARSCLRRPSLSASRPLPLPPPHYHLACPFFPFYLARLPDDFLGYIPSLPLLLRGSPGFSERWLWCSEPRLLPRSDGVPQKEAMVRTGSTVEGALNDWCFYVLVKGNILQGRV